MCVGPAKRMMKRTVKRTAGTLEESKGRLEHGVDVHVERVEMREPNEQQPVANRGDKESVIVFEREVVGGVTRAVTSKCAHSARISAARQAFIMSTRFFRVGTLSYKYPPISRPHVLPIMQTGDESGGGGQLSSR